MKSTYKKQVALLLSVLPEVAKEKCFALHGGTAINLFVRNMPRLSVDIDLTYLPIEDRTTSLARIAAALERIKKSIEKVVPDVRVSHKEEIGKLLISKQGGEVKLEVNLVNRGTLNEPREMPLCGKAQHDFEAFVSMPVVPMGQLFGGKIVAALARQHPRDMFDIKYLLQNEGFSEEVKKGFLFCLLCSDRPINEVVKPNFHDQRSAMDNQFAGMTDETFSYEEYETIRETLVAIIHANLTEADKAFLLDVKNVMPDWSIYDFERFPAIQWKLQNLQKFKNQNSKKHRELYEALAKKLKTENANS